MQGFLKNLSTSDVIQHKINNPALSTAIPKTLKNNSRFIFIAMKNTLKPGWLIYIPWHPKHKGGVNSVVKNLITEIPRHSEWETFLAYQSWSNEGITNEKKELPLKIRRLYSREKTAKELVKFIIFLPHALFKLHQQITTRNIQCINPHFVTLHALLFLLYKKWVNHNIRLVLSFHGSDVRSIDQFNAIEYRLFNYLLRQANQLTTCSNALKTELLERMPGLSNIRVIYNGINASIADNIEAQQHTDAGGFQLPQPYILHVGTFDLAIKGQDLLINAFKHFAIQKPNYRLVLVGTGEKDKQAIQQLITANKLNEKITLLENLEHKKIMHLMKYADFFVLPSRRESFGLVVLESGLVKTPVIAAAVGGIPEIITHNKTGLLFQADNMDDLLEKMLYFAHLSDAEKSVLATGLYQKIEQSFQWPTIINTLTGLIT